jgi:hypothetical protein
MPPKARPKRTTSRLIGYARVSTEDQGTGPQRDELRAAMRGNLFRGSQLGMPRHRKGTALK